MKWVIIECDNPDCDFAFKSNYHMVGEMRGLLKRNGWQQKRHRFKPDEDYCPAHRKDKK